MRKGLVLVVMCVAMLFAAASSVSAQAPNDEYKATLEKMLELSGSTGICKGYGTADDSYVETTVAFGFNRFLGWFPEKSGKQNSEVSWRNFMLLFIRSISHWMI